MRRLAPFLCCALAACGPDSLLALPQVSLNPMSLFAGGNALPDDGEEPDGPYLRLAQGRRESDARLISQQGERRMWRTRGGVVVATDGVRVVATSGLRVMVAATRFDGPDPVADPQSLGSRSADARRVVDVMTEDRDPASMRFGIALNCRLTSRPGTEADTILITETCRGEGLGLIRNRFWMDRDSSSIHTSEQWIGPRTAPLRISHNLDGAAEEPAAETAPEASPEAPPEAPLAGAVPANPLAAPLASPSVAPPSVSVAPPSVAPPSGPPSGPVAFLRRLVSGAPGAKGRHARSPHRLPHGPRDPRRFLNRASCPCRSAPPPRMTRRISLPMPATPAPAHSWPIPPPGRMAGWRCMGPPARARRIWQPSWPRRGAGR